MSTPQGGRCEKDPEGRLLRLAAKQHGVVTRSQGLACGLTKAMLDGRLCRNRLLRVHPGVYLVAGSAGTFEQRAFAAAAWAGAHAYVSHRAAAYLWEIIEQPPKAVEVVSTRKLTRPPPGVRTHFTRFLPPRDRGRLHNVPLTSPARTVIDLAAVLDQAEFDQAVQRAVVGGRVSARQLREQLNTAGRGRRRTTALSGSLPLDERPHVPSALERAVAELMSGCDDLPPFVAEYPITTNGRVYYLDFAFPLARVAVEADGRRWHTDAGAFERDRAKQNALASLGWRVVRVTDRQVRTDPEGVKRLVLDVVRRPPMG